MCQQQGEFIDFEKSACNVNRSFDHSRGVVIDSVVLVPVLATTTAKPLQVAFFDTAPTLVLPHIHCQCESPVVTSASSVVTTEFSITPPPKIMRASGSHAFDARLTVFKDQNFENALDDGELFPASADRFYFEVASQDYSDVVGAVNCTASPKAEATGPHASRFLSESCASGAFDAQFHEADSQSAVRLSIRKFAFHEADTVYLTCVVRRCVETPCGVCGGRRLREVGIGAEDEVVTVVTQVRLQNKPTLHETTTSAILAANTWQKTAATTLAPEPKSTTGPRYVVSGAFFVAINNPSLVLADDKAREAFTEAMAEMIALETSREGISKEAITVSVSAQDSLGGGRLRRLATGLNVVYKISALPDASPFEGKRMAIAVAEKMNAKSEEGLLLIVSAALRAAGEDTPTLAEVRVLSVTVTSSASVLDHQGNEEFGLALQNRREGAISSACKLFDSNAYYLLTFLFLACVL